MDEVLDCYYDGRGRDCSIGLDSSTGCNEER